jgi:predicted dienelactone hydrolase
VSAPATGTALPVIVFSHGYGPMGGSMETYAPLVEHWVEAGFAVLQPQHLDAEGLTVDDPRNAELWRLRIDDLRRVVDELGQIEACVPGLAGRLDHTRIAAAGHSYGATSASALAGARVIGTDGSAGASSYLDERVRAAVLLCLTGTGDSLSPFAREHFPFMNPDFSALTTRSLLVAGDADDSPLSTRGPEWFTDAFRLAPGVTDLLTLVGGEHSLGGINGSQDSHITDENPDRVALVQQATTAWLRHALGLGAEAWPVQPDPALGRVDSKARTPTR